MLALGGDVTKAAVATATSSSIIAGTITICFIAFFFSSSTTKTNLATAMAFSMIKQLDRIKNWRSGLKEKAVHIQVPSSAENSPSHDEKRIIRAHYLEREAKAAAVTGNNAKRRRKDLLVLPGFTSHASLIMSDLVWKLQPPPEWRIIVMELPLHDKNVDNFDGNFPDWEDLFNYTVAFAKAVGMLGGGGDDDDDAPLLHLCGYSLGGNISLRCLHEHQSLIHKVVLIAPAFPGKTMDDNFRNLGNANPRLIHAWQTLDECRGFATSTALGCQPGHLLTYDFILRGIQKSRQEIYGKHENFFDHYWKALNNDGEGEEEESPLRETLLRQVQTPVLLITGERDNCISSDKCRTCIQNVIGKKYCSFHELADTGHYGGPESGPFSDVNILYSSAPICADFLFGE